ncbi:NADH:flavin oxidoreductase/NADH oxidase family protein [Glaciecola siphonariae]|uniref:NADH:flavin oxidoreductase/NADH oxidase family protein n=1 Tax=Glaciecola siphonariae TaxID=521012 RepID=A0ABV9LYR7_9ALTE
MLFTPITLPCGQVIKNRAVKAAMEENMADKHHFPSPELKTLYKTWAHGEVGLIISGNVMVDKMAMTGPGGVVLEKNTPLHEFRDWAREAKQNDCKAILQINHPGRQVMKAMGGKVLAPSAIAVNIGKHSNLLAPPKAMSEEEIQDVIQRFIYTAVNAKEAGFDGVQIHAAHGYLLSQFLSPLTNKRTDKWGGSPENRARIVYQIITKVRDAVGEHSIVALKMNSADFQRGGFDVEDAIDVVKHLNTLNIDFIELSGGSYEAPAMQGKSGDERTLAREAYFLKFATQISEHAKMPLMTTGGIKRFETAQSVLENGVDLVGMASALAYEPSLISAWKSSPEHVGFVPHVSWKDKAMSGLATMALVKRQLRKLGNNQPTNPKCSPLLSLILDQLRIKRLTKTYRKWIGVG